jgi:PBSX family phage terminase large subunit
MAIYQNKSKIINFNFKEFSSKQKFLLNWWRHPDISQHDIVIADGSIRSGKTIACICSFMSWSQSNFDNENFIIAGKSIGSLKRNVIDPLRQIIRAWGFEDTYNRSGNYLTIGSNVYYFFGANTEASQDTLQGLTAAGALADEIVLFPRSFVDQMIGRCSVYGAKIFCNCNPDGPYHDFKVEFIDKTKDKNILYLHFDMDDNLTLSEDVKAKFRRMYSGVFFKRYILGQWVMAEGLIYDMFDESKHVIDTSNIKFDYYYVSIDYGTYNACSFGLWGVNKKIINGKSLNCAYRVKEYYYNGKESGRQKTDEQYYNDLVDFTGDIKIYSIIIDPSASSFITTIRSKQKYHVQKAENSVLEGIRNVATCLNTGRLFFDINCKSIIKEFSSYSWDDKAAKLGEDKPLKVSDHAMDECRYMVNTILYNNYCAVL